MFQTFCIFLLHSKVWGWGILMSHVSSCLSSFSFSSLYCVLNVPNFLYFPPSQQSLGMGNTDVSCFFLSFFFFFFFSLLCFECSKLSVFSSFTAKSGDGEY